MSDRVDRARTHLPGGRPSWLLAVAVGMAIVVGGLAVARPWERPAPAPTPSLTGPFVPRIVATVAVSPVSGQPSWSPGGTILAVPTAGIDLYDRTGRHVGEVWASDGVWVAADALLARDADPKAGWRGTVAIRTLDGSVREGIAGQYSPVLLPSGHGEVALLPAPANANEIPSTTVVWSAGGLAGPVPGIARAWSSDGRRLAVFHQTRPASGVGGQPIGWLEVLAYPGLARVAAFPDVAVSVSGDAVFDPSGPRLAVCVRGDGGPPCTITVLDMASGRSTSVGAGAEHGFAWTAEGTLLCPDEGGTRVLAWDGTDPPRDSGLGPASVVRVGALAIAAGVWNEAASPSLAIASSGRVERLALPGGLVVGPEWSPHAQFLAAIVDVNGAYALVLAELVPDDRAR